MRDDHCLEAGLVFRGTTDLNSTSAVCMVLVCAALLMQKVFLLLLGGYGSGRDISLLFYLL